jgi:hypothetical protein
MLRRTPCRGSIAIESQAPFASMALRTGASNRRLERPRRRGRPAAVKALARAGKGRQSEAGQHLGSANDCTIGMRAAGKAAAV